MAQKKKPNLGGRPRVDTTRVVLRLPTPFVNQMIEMGAKLGLGSAQGAARHFLTLGMQASLGALSSQQSVDVSKQMLQVLQAQVASMAALEVDMFTGAETPIIDSKKAALRPAPARARRPPAASASTMLDTKRLNRNQRGARKQG